MKKGIREYLKPTLTLYQVQATSSLLAISAETTNPVEGGDPTGGDPSTANPFAGTPAKRQWFETEE